MKNRGRSLKRDVVKINELQSSLTVAMRLIEDHGVMLNAREHTINDLIDQRYRATDLLSIAADLLACNGLPDSALAFRIQARLLVGRSEARAVGVAPQHPEEAR